MSSVEHQPSNEPEAEQPLDLSQEQLPQKPKRTKRRLALLLAGATAVGGGAYLVKDGRLISQVAAKIAQIFAEPDRIGPYSDKYTQIIKPTELAAYTPEEVRESITKAQAKAKEDLPWPASTWVERVLGELLSKDGQGNDLVDDLFSAANRNGDDKISDQEAWALVVSIKGLGQTEGVGLPKKFELHPDHNLSPRLEGFVNKYWSTLKSFGELAYNMKRIRLRVDGGMPEDMPISEPWTKLTHALSVLDKSAHELELLKQDGFDPERFESEDEYELHLDEQREIVELAQGQYDEAHGRVFDAFDEHRLLNEER